MPPPPPAKIDIAYQGFADSPLGRISKAAFINNSRGLSRARVLRSFALVYLLSGAGEFESGKIRQPVEAGDLMLLFPNVPHRYGPGETQNWNEFYILFEGPVFEHWENLGLLDSNHPVERLEPVAYWRRRFHSVVEPAVGARQVSALSSVCKLQHVLADVLVSVTEGKMNPEDRRWLDRACALLEEAAPAEELDWNAIAGELHMSYENFRKRFARLAGVPPSKYRIRKVMEQAAEHLMQSRLTLKEVADLCGFCNEFHFSRRFKQIVGLSPRDFRRQLPH